jgi:hypothetical protein
MKKPFALAAALVVSVALSATAFAQPKPDTGEKRTEELDFEGDVVETSFLKPDASLIEGETRKGGASLLKIRKDFIPEIVRSAEDI